MAWDLANLQVEAGGRDSISRADRPVGRGAGDRPAVAGGEIQLGVGELCRVAVPDNQRAVGPALLQGAIAGNMVAVAMGVQNRRRHDLLLVQQGENLLRAEARDRPPGNRGGLSAEMT